MRMEKRAEMSFDQQFEALEQRLDSFEKQLQRINERLKEGDFDISLAIEYSRANAIANGLRDTIEHLEVQYEERRTRKASTEIGNRNTEPPP